MHLFKNLLIDSRPAALNPGGTWCRWWKSAHAMMYLQAWHISWKAHGCVFDRENCICSFCVGTRCVFDCVSSSVSFSYTARSLGRALRLLLLARLGFRMSVPAEAGGQCISALVTTVTSSGGTSQEAIEGSSVVSFGVRA